MNAQTLPTRTEDAGASLVNLVSAARPYLRHLCRPLHLESPDAVSPVQRSEAVAVPAGARLIEHVFGILEIPLPRSGAVPADALEEVVGRRIQAAAAAVLAECGHDLEAAIQLTASIHAALSDARQIGSIRARDGIELEFRSAGAGPRVVMLLGPCAVPAAILDAWISTLAAEFRVIAPQTRGFSSPEAGGLVTAFGLQRQAQDIFDVMDSLQIDSAHIMGVCGGAVVAMQAAALQTQRFSSVSLWHGDFNVGSEECLTRYQSDLKWLMTEAAQSVDAARWLQRRLAGTEAVARTRADLVHLLLFPFATPELLHRYGRANSEIMNADVQRLARAVTQPALVVTSAEDETAHPEGSRRVARWLPHAALHVEPDEHLAFFEARESALRRLRDFLSRD